MANLVYDPAFLAEAWARVRGNTGARSAGVDGQTARAIEAGPGAAAFLEGLRADLKAGTFRPVPVRERMIPKSGGKRRRLGIPTVRDRVCQAALKLVLEPIFEADFEPCSYGFRPFRRAQDAVAEIQYVYTYPSKQAVTAIKRTVRTLTRRTSQPNLRVLLVRLNAALRGWANYFKHGVSKRTFSYLDSFAWRRVTRWLRKRHISLNWAAIRRRFMHGWRIADGGITLFMPSTVAVTRYRYRGTRILTPWTLSTDTSAELVESRMQ